MNNVLSDGGVGGQAAAQTTPATYCATLGNPSCEVLNVEIGGSTSTGSAVFLVVKECLNGKFASRLVYASPLSLFWYGIMDNGSGGAGLASGWYSLAAGQALWGGSTTNPGGYPSVDLAKSCF